MGLQLKQELEELEAFCLKRVQTAHTGESSVDTLGHSRREIDIVRTDQLCVGPQKMAVVPLTVLSMGYPGGKMFVL